MGVVAPGQNLPTPGAARSAAHLVARVDTVPAPELCLDRSLHGGSTGLCCLRSPTSCSLIAVWTKAHEQNKNPVY